ncbi:hypothetical protein FJR45_09225 [Sulfurimonas sediminis]|uniref:Uncharacterized protein n=1 Tax=Sulfurimonas sediminis TaxID=2590020 RepID=A0A7M1B311_9BACT|nr:hypothetical protein [Sulfurimonas sediminis]QOP44113.1 hypothetical protein FJR45_09225 [Sulfurimonas sediminis]
MDIKDLNELRNEFEMMQKQAMQAACDDGSCAEDEYEDYPDYLKAIYAEIMPPAKSGIYFSRWDLKRIAAELGESFAIDVRERMFKNFMQWIATPEDMLAVVDQFKKHMDMKCTLYNEYVQNYPAMKEIFEPKIQKAEKAKKYLDKVYIEFFT